MSDMTRSGRSDSPAMSRCRAWRPTCSVPMDVAEGLATSRPGDSGIIAGPTERADATTVASEHQPMPLKLA